MSEDSGDCFFEAIYETALSKGNLYKIVAILGYTKTIPDINTFVRAFRNCMSNFILEGLNDDVIAKSYQTFKEYSDEVRIIVSKTMPQWSRDLLLSMPELDEFRKIYAYEIRKPGSLISEIDCAIATAFLLTCDIRLRVWMDGIRPAFKEDPDEVILYYDSLNEDFKHPNNG